MPPSRVSSIHAMDLESGEEFERIKQNFRSTVVEPDVTGVCCFFGSPFNSEGPEIECRMLSTWSSS